MFFIYVAIALISLFVLVGKTYPHLVQMAYRLQDEENEYLAYRQNEREDAAARSKL